MIAHMQNNRQQAIKELKERKSAKGAREGDVNQVTDDGQLREHCKSLHARLSDSMRAKVELQPRVVSARQYQNMQRASAYGDVAGFGHSPMGYLLSPSLPRTACSRCAHRLFLSPLPSLIVGKIAACVLGVSVWPSTSGMLLLRCVMSSRGATASVRSGLIVVIHESELCLCFYRYGTVVSDGGTPGGTPEYGGRGSEASLKKKTKTARKYVKCETHTQPQAAVACESVWKAFFLLLLA